MQISHNFILANKFFENVAMFKYLGTTVTKVTFTKELRAD